MDKGYNKVFWGLFIATFNINFGMIKILPTFVGWIVVVTGIELLEKNFETEAFNYSNRYSMWLILLSLVGGVSSIFIGSTINSSIIQFYPVLSLIVELLFGYKFMEGSIEYLKSVGKEILAENYIANLKTYIIFMLISILTYIISITFNSAGLNTGVAILFIIIRISLLVMTNRLKKLEIDSTEA